MATTDKSKGRSGTSSLRSRVTTRAAKEMERYVDELRTDWPFRTWRRTPAEDLSWTPPVEVYEKPDRFVVRVEVPGVNVEDVAVSVAGHTLSVKGERKADRTVDKIEYRRSEFAYGTFSRTLTMSAGLSTENIEASCEDGILEVTIPKAEGAGTSAIKVKKKGA